MKVRNIDGDEVMINDPDTFMDSFESLIKLTEGVQDKLTDEQKDDIERKMFIYNQIVDYNKEEKESIKHSL